MANADAQHEDNIDLILRRMQSEDILLDLYVPKNLYLFDQSSSSFSIGFE